MRPTLPLIMLAALLQGCTLTAPAPMPMPVPMPPMGSCGAAGLQGLVGTPVALLPATGPWGALRVIRPGQMVTMDYSDSRLNATVDGRDIILSLTCG